MMYDFPTFLPGELFNSAISRFCDLWGIKSLETVKREIFGGRDFIPSNLVPPLLDVFARRYGCLTSLELLRAHTPFPYFGAFLPVLDQAEARELACRGDSPNAIKKLVSMRAPRLSGTLRYARSAWRETARSTASHIGIGRTS